MNVIDLKFDINDLLNYYYKYDDYIESLIDNIDRVEKGKVPILKSIDKTDKVQSSPKFIDSLSFRENISENLKKSLAKYIAVVMIIDRAIEQLADDEYFDILVLTFKDKKKYSEIAEELNLDVRTVKKHKDRLINNIRNLILPSLLIK